MGNKNSNVNLIYDKKKNKVVKKKTSSNNSKPKKKLVNEELENELGKTVVLSKKEINRKKYQARQQRYNKETKKKVIDIDYTIVTNDFLNKQNKEEDKPVIEKKAVVYSSDNNINSKLKEEDIELVKKKDIVKKEKNVVKETKNVKKEKRKYFVLESDIPLVSDKVNTKIRIKKYLKEAIIFAIIITIINLFAILFFDYVNVLKIFDVNGLNIVVTVFLSLIINYLISFFIDCLVTEIWVKIKNSKNKVGDLNGSTRIKQKKHRENITN